MKIKICFLALFAAIIGSFISQTPIQAKTIKIQQRGMERCTVADYSGTLLNVRSTPNGKKIVAKLKNGTFVFIEEETSDAQDRGWAKVRLTGKNVYKPLGWVLRGHLNCE